MHLPILGCGLPAVILFVAVMLLVPLGYTRSYGRYRRPKSYFRRSRSSRSSTYKGVIKAEKQVSLVLMILGVITIFVLALAPMLYGAVAWSAANAQTLITDTFVDHIGEFLAIICGAGMIYHKARNITMIGLGTFCIGYIVLLLRLVWV